MKKKNKYAGLTNDQIIAAAEGDVQYGPQIAQIRDLYTDAAKQKVSDINSAKQSAQSAVAFANAQRPTTKKVYKRGDQQANRTAADVNAAFGKLGDAAKPYNAQIAAEQGGAKNRINESRIQALQELTERATGAKAGMALAIHQARASYADNKGTLDQKLSDLMGQRGSYIAGRLATLANQRADRGTKIKVAKIGAGAGMDKPITSGAFAGKTPAEVNGMSDTDQQDTIDAYNKAHPGKGTGGGGLNVKQVGDFSDNVSGAMSWAKKMRNDPKNAAKFQGLDPKQVRHLIADQLLAGSSPPKGGGAPAIPKFPQLALSVALDQVFDKHVSRQNAAALHKRGVKVSDIANVASFTDWLPAERKRTATTRRKAAHDRAAANRVQTQSGAFGPYGTFHR